MKKIALIIAIIILIIITILLIRQPKQSVIVNYSEADSIQYHFDSLALMSSDSSVSLWVHYPVANNVTRTTVPAINSTVEELLYSLMFEGYDPAIPVKDQLITEFEFLVTDRAAINSSAPWEIEGDVTFVYNKNGVISARFSVYQYMGGAHGMASDLYISGSCESALEEIPLASLFSENSKKELTAIAESIFREEQDIADTVVLVDVGYTFKDDVFSLTDNFAVTAEGLLFHYNPYDIASYATGEITLLIPYEEFKPLLINGTERFWDE